MKPANQLPNYLNSITAQNYYMNKLKALLTLNYMIVWTRGNWDSKIAFLDGIALFLIVFKNSKEGLLMKTSITITYIEYNQNLFDIDHLPCSYNGIWKSSLTESNLLGTKAAVWSRSSKQAFLKILQYSQENNCVGVSF